MILPRITTIISTARRSSDEPSICRHLLFFPLLSPNDRAHRRAVEFSEQHRPALLTTAWVMTELADGLAGTPNRHLFAKILLETEQQAGNLVMPPTEELYRRGIDLYETRPDKSWSLTDCISMVVMQDHDVIEALTADRHFEQAGLVPLLA